MDQFIDLRSDHNTALLTHLQAMFDRMPVNQKPHYIYEPPRPFLHDKSVSENFTLHLIV